MIVDTSITKLEIVQGDPFEFDFTIDPDDESTVTTFSGGSAAVGMIFGSTKVLGVGTITGPLKGHGSFAAVVSQLVSGAWELQIQATPPAGLAQTMRRIQVTIHKSAFAP